jgi:hypothetical protein
MALQVYKVLGQVKIPSTNTYYDLYTVPANAMAQVYVIVNNFNSATHTFNVAVSRNGAAVTNGDEAYHDVSLTKGTEYVTATFTLAAGDIIRVQASDLDFTFQVHGVEIYTPSTGVYFDVYENGVITTVRLYGLETNLNYLKYSDEDDNLRIGFRGYGPNNEMTVSFPSSADRLVFVQALEQARVYGNYGTFDPVVPMISAGNNIAYSGITTSTTTTTTAAPTTTTTSSTTSTTTLVPDPVIEWSFTRAESASDAEFELSLNDGATVVSLIEPSTQTSFTGEATIASPYEVDGIRVYCSNSSISQIKVYDITDGILLYADPATAALPPPSPQYAQGSTEIPGFTAEQGKRYRIEADVLY